MLLASKKSGKSCPNLGEGGRGHLDEIQKNSSFSSRYRPLRSTKKSTTCCAALKKFNLGSQWLSKLHLAKITPHQAMPVDIRPKVDLQKIIFLSYDLLHYCLLTVREYLMYKILPPLRALLICVYKPMHVWDTETWSMFKLNKLSVIWAVPLFVTVIPITGSIVKVSYTIRRYISIFVDPRVYFWIM